MPDSLWNNSHEKSPKGSELSPLVSEYAGRGAYDHPSSLAQISSSLYNFKVHRQPSSAMPPGGTGVSDLNARIG